MKKRILSFVLMLAMLFSCLSLEIFATSEGTTASSTGTASSVAEDLSQQKMAEYFAKYGEIGKSDGYNLSAAELAEKVKKSYILTNTEFVEWTDYNNANRGQVGNVTGTDIISFNESFFDRIVPGSESNNGVANYFITWNDSVIARKSDGTAYSLEIGENGEYVDGDLQALVEAGTVVVEKGVPYRTDKVSGEYLQRSSSKKPTQSNYSTYSYLGAAYTITFDIRHAKGTVSYFEISCRSYTSADFAQFTISLAIHIAEDGTLSVRDGKTSNGTMVETDFKVADDEWTQISITHTPRGMDGVRDVDADGKVINSTDLTKRDNTVHYYANGKYLKTTQGTTTTTEQSSWKTNDGGVINPASDFTMNYCRFGQYSYGFDFDDLRIYWGQNVENASQAHNLTYTHKHDLTTNQNVLIATCTDDGCDAREELSIDLCDKSGVSNLSVADVSELLEAADRNAWVLADFTGGKIAELSFSDGVYREDTNGDGSVNSSDDTIIQWVNISYSEDATGNEQLIWQRPIAKNPATNKPFTEAEAATLSEKAQSYINFENGIPYYVGPMSNEYLEYKVDSGSQASVKDIIVNEPANSVIGQTYTITMDITYHGGEFSPLQLRSYTASNFASLSYYPLKIKDGKLYVVDLGKSTVISGVSIKVGETYEITYVHAPRGLDGERDVVDGYSTDDDDTYFVFVDGVCVATGNVLPKTSAYKEWNYVVDGVTKATVSPTSDFCVQFIRLGQVSKAADANGNVSAVTTNLVSVDNVKCYAGEFLECNHHFTENPAECDWCGKDFDLQHCDLCEGTVLAENIAVVLQNATLGDSIVYNAYLKLLKDASYFGDARILLDTKADGGTRSAEYKIADLLPEASGDAKGLYKVSIPLRSIDMTREITISVESDEANTGVEKTNLDSYLNELLGSTTVSYYVRSLVKATKNYGSYAQIYFEGKNGNPEDLGALPNANLSAIDKNLSAVDVNDLATYAAVIAGDAVEINSLKLVLDSVTELRILFRDGENVTVSENGKTLNKVASEYEGYSYVSLVDASPATFGKAHTVVFTAGGEQTTVSVSAYSVLYIMLQNADEELVNVAAAMYRLGQSAYDYKYYYLEGNAPIKQAWDEDGVLKLLCIGNSFSIDAMEWIGEIATDLGYTEVVFGNLYIGGCYIDRHIKEIEGNTTAYTYYLESGSASTGLKKKTYPGYQAINAIASENWDFISMQQGSARSYTESEYANLSVLADYVTELCPGATFVWHMTWAYQEEYAMDKKGITQMQMYEGILNCVQNCVMENDALDFDTLVPSGTAIQNARTSYLGNDLTRDGYHLDKGIARYIAALTFFAVVTGEDISKVEWAPTSAESGVADVDAAARAVAIESVLNAIANPYEVTQSQYTTPPQE